MSDHKERLLFCVLCFADTEGGSWGDGVVGSEDASHCLNCGAGGSAVPLQRWAVENIRKNASWVGKRYYPADEDAERYEELQLLRALVQDFPGRTAEPAHEEGMWSVRQALKKPGSSMSIVVKARSAAEALEAARLQLPYVPTMN